MRVVQSFQFHFGFTHLHTVDPQGRSGGLALYYDSSYKVTIISSSNRLIDIETKYKGKRIFLSFVYGEPNQDLRAPVWERLTRIGIARLEPWFIIGDLNDITCNHEKERESLRCADSFIPFNNMIRDSGLLEFLARETKFPGKDGGGKGKGQ